MPLPVIPGVVRATVGGQIAGGGRWANTVHAQRVDLGASDLVSITALHVALLAFYSGTVFQRVPAATTLEAGDYTPLDGTSGAFHLPGGPLVGGDGGVTTPPEVAACLTIRTALRGRRARGRIFLPAFTAGHWATGQLLVDDALALPAAAVVLQAALLVVGWTLGVASYGLSVTYDRHVRPPVKYETTWAPFFTPVSSFSMDRLADVIRGRKR